jgi:pimeloyl-ACP methyl ester carboxylesterase
MTERTWTQRLAGQLTAKSLWQTGRVLARGPEASVFDLPNFVRGFRFTLDSMWAEASQQNLRALVPALNMPVFFFLGRRDPWVRPETSVAYFDALRAPSKNLVWFEESGPRNVHERTGCERTQGGAVMARIGTSRPDLYDIESLGGGAHAWEDQ